MDDNEREQRALARATVRPPKQLPPEKIKPPPFATALRALIIEHWEELDEWNGSADAESSPNGNVIADYAFAAKFLKDKAAEAGVTVIANAITDKVMKGYADEKSRKGYGRRKLLHAYRGAYAKIPGKAAAE